ncbi:IclR family transcriptional regulator [Halosimplex salinum]|uniref:IclR family transcriptional regulator n=1 Tax=Halosimplex salinum TaxID=1710538 RepID=UPI000F482600|nr:IclR family transcriptional regulator [Halosimplex salinum]
MSGDRATDPEEVGEEAVVGAVETSHEVVEALRDLGAATVTEVATETGLSKGGAYKHLNTLRKRDFVTKTGTEYRLGFGFLDLGGHLRFQYPGASTIKDKIQTLASETGEACLFTIEEHGRAVTLFRETGNRGVFTRTRVGTRLYLHQTAGGKAILSQLPEETVDDIVDRVGLPGATENTITDREALFDELARVRERGYAFNREESTDGLVALAAPLVPDDEILGACAVAGPRYRIGGDQLESELPETLLGVVNELELNIAYS